MKKIIRNLTVSKRIIVGLAMPLVALLIVIGINTYSSYKEYSRSIYLSEIVDAIAEMSNMIHTLQTERGISAGYLAKGGVVPESLKAARKEADWEIEKFHEIVLGLSSRKSASAIKNMREVDGLLYEIPAFRSKIDSGTVKLPEALKFYSSLIKKLMHVGMNATELASNTKLALEIVALLELGEAKEFAGQERGLINGVMGVGKFTEKQFVNFNNHAARQELMIENFIANEPEIHREEYRALVQSTGIEKVEALREKLFNFKTNSVPLDFTAKEWFDTTTDRINALRGIEQKAIGDIVSEKKEYQENLRNGIIISSLMFALIMAITAFVVYRVVRSITIPLKRLESTMGEISSGHLDVDIVGQDRRGEFGRMARALQIFKDSAIDKQKFEDEAAEARAVSEKEREEQDARKSQEAASISRAVEHLGGALERLANGDLSVHIDTTFDHGLDQLRINFNDAVDRLSGTLTDVKNSIDTINTGTDEMKIASTELSGRTEQQAHSLQNVSSALEEITQAVNASAGDSSSAASLANEVSGETNKSLDIVNEAVEAMNRIESASDQISSIITVIDEITFQTNLLALNAGVEAARAGDAGKGFAVVAQEVRELAHRSASSASEIKDLISASSKEVKEGVRHVTATGEALMNISGKVDEISKSVESIAAASQRQSESLNDCSKSANTLDQSTQQNAAMAEEATAVMQNLARDSDILSQAVERFKLTSARAELQSKAA